MSQTKEITEEYRLKKVLKATPQSTVFQAAHPQTDQEVTIKLLSPMVAVVPEERKERFLKEMSTLQALELASIPGIVEYGFTPEGSAFIVFRAVAGVGLDTLKGAAPERMLELLKHVAAALKELTAAGLCHHDLSPDNILVVDEGGVETVRLFGLGTSAYLAETAGGALLGHSPESELYAAPELLDPALGPAEEPWRSDLYSLAKIVCDLSGAEMMGLGSGAPQVTLPEEVRLAAADGDLLQAVLAAALHFEPAKRAVTFGELEEALAPAELQRTVAVPRSEVVPPPLPPEETARLPLASVPMAVSAESAAQLPPVPAGQQAAERLEPPGEGPSTLPGAPASEPEPVPEPEGATVADVRLATTPAEESPLRPSLTPTPTPSSVFDPHKTAPSLVPPPVPPPPEIAAARKTAPPPPVPPPQPAPSPRVEPPPTPPPTASPEDSPAASATPAPKLAPPAAVAPGKPRSLVVPVVSASVVLMLTGVVMTAILVLRGLGFMMGAAPTPTPILEPTPGPMPTASPEVTIHPQLAVAENLLAAGDLNGARQAVDSLTSEEVEALSGEEIEVYNRLMQSLQTMDVSRAIADLEKGLESSSVKMLRRAVPVLSNLDAAQQAETPGLAQKLERAREALRVDELIKRAFDQNDHVQVLERAPLAMQLLPQSKKILEYREVAAMAIEERAEAAAAAGNLGQVVRELESVEKSWPDREGLKERLATLRAQRSAEERLQGVLEEALAKGTAGEPDAGLAILDRSKPSGSLAQRFQEVRSQLAEQLARLDVKPPVVTLADSSQQLVYKKNEPFRVPLRITDDYRVASMTAMVQSEDKPGFKSVDLTPSGPGDYVLEIPVAIHGNGKVDFYVEARDVSGHTAQLGSPQAPLHVDRKRWWR